MSDGINRKMQRWVSGRARGAQGTHWHLGGAACHRQAQAGFGMIEVLIAALVFSVGALGMSTVQITAKRGNYEAAQRSVATSLARDILERMRSNPSELPQYAVSELGSRLAPSTDHCTTRICSPGPLAQRDLDEWNEFLSGDLEVATPARSGLSAGGLLDHRACITHAAGLVTVAIAWRGATNMANPDASTCGQSSGLYGPNYTLRRLLLLTTYIGGV